MVQDQFSGSRGHNYFLRKEGGLRKGLYIILGTVCLTSLYKLKQTCVMGINTPKLIKPFCVLGSDKDNTR